MKKQVLITMAVCLFSFAAHADYSDSGTSTVKVSKDSAGRIVTLITTTQFSVDWLYEDVTPNPILLKKVTEEKTIESTEGSSGKLSVVARGTKKTSFDTVLWKIQEEAHDGAATDDKLYLTWLLGCCDSATTYRVYNVKTGKLLLSYDDRSGDAEGAQTQPFVVEVPNSKPELKRFLGILTENATRDFKPGKTADGLTKLATVSYAGLNGATRKYDLFGPEPSGTSLQVTAKLIDSSTTPGKNEIRFNHLTLWTSDGISDPLKALQGFSLKIMLDGETSTVALIPFAADQLDLTRVTLPAGFRLLPGNSTFL